MANALRIQREHVLAALADHGQEIQQDTDEPTDYYLVHAGKRYALETVIHLAVQRASHAGADTNNVTHPRGSSAVRLLRGLQFQIERKHARLATTDWSAQEVRALVEDYFKMLTDEQAGKPYSKAQHRRALQSLLDRRSAASIEFKHQNVSAVLRDLGLPCIHGYKPASNYQGLLFEIVQDYLRADPDLAARIRRTIPRVVQPENFTNATFASALESPPDSAARAKATAPRRRRAVKHDFQTSDEANRALGRAGEDFVCRYERWRLTSAGKPELAERVVWLSELQGDGPGYDIESFDWDGSRIFIEVKTTNCGSDSPFLVTRNEINASREIQGAYRLYRVFDMGRKPGLYVLRGDLSAVLQLEPTVYEALPKTPIAARRARN